MAAERALEAGPALKDNITGTNKDLRRLTMTQSKTILLKLGLSEDDIKGLSFLQVQPVLYQALDGCQEGMS